MVNREIISKRLRNDFREFLVSWPIRKIQLAFESAGISPDLNIEPQVSGERRAVVEQHYGTLNFSDIADIRRIIQFFEEVMRISNEDLESEADSDSRGKAIESLVRSLERDGISWDRTRMRGVTPEIRAILDAVESGNTISSYTRQQIIDTFSLFKMNWSGSLPDSDFLSRLFRLEDIPSTDSRFSDAAGDIWQHTQNNDDWPSDWVFSDERFGLATGPDERFLLFICESLHPKVRAKPDDVKKLCTAFNEALHVDGWELYPSLTISGRPIFSAKRLVLNRVPGMGALKDVARAIDANYVNMQITRLEVAATDDPTLAIGTAKEFIETVCKTILHERDVLFGNAEDIPSLVKLVREELELLPENISSNAKGAKSIKRLLSNLGTIAQGMAEIRSLYGTGHGQHAKANTLEPRHAKLAVGAAATLAVFLFETHQSKPKK